MVIRKSSETGEICGEAAAGTANYSHVSFTSSFCVRVVLRQFPRHSYLIFLLPFPNAQSDAFQFLHNLCACVCAILINGAAYSLCSEYVCVCVRFRVYTSIFLLHRVLNPSPPPIPPIPIELAQRFNLCRLARARIG